MILLKLILSIVYGLLTLSIAGVAIYGFWWAIWGCEKKNKEKGKKC